MTLPIQLTAKPPSVAPDSTPRAEEGVAADPVGKLTASFLSEIVKVSESVKNPGMFICGAGITIMVLALVANLVLEAGLTSVEYIATLSGGLLTLAAGCVVLLGPVRQAHQGLTETAKALAEADQRLRQLHPGVRS